MMTAKSPPPNEKELRHFGLLMGLFISVIFGVFLPWLVGHAAPVWPWVVGATFGCIALISARLLRPVFRVWMAFALVMNWIMTRLVLGIVFYIIVWPMGWAMRLAGKDPMGRKLNQDIGSYRILTAPGLPDHMKRPY
jgi:hypothetical protein